MSADNSPYLLNLPLFLSTFCLISVQKASKIERIMFLGGKLTNHSSARVDDVLDGPEFSRHTAKLSVVLCAGAALRGDECRSTLRASGHGQPPQQVATLSATSRENQASHRPLVADAREMAADHAS